MVLGRKFVLASSSMVPKYDLGIVLHGPEEKVIPRDPAQWSQGGHFHSGTCSMVGLLLETLIPGGLKTSGLHIFFGFQVKRLVSYKKIA